MTLNMNTKSILNFIIIFVFTLLQLQFSFFQCVTSLNNDDVNATSLYTDDNNATSLNNVTSDVTTTSGHNVDRSVKTKQKDQGDVFASSAHLQQLASSELEFLLPNFRRYVAEERQRLDDIER